MKNRTPLIALTLFAFVFAGCSKHSPETAASLPESKDFVALTNAMTAKTGESIISIDKLDGKFVCYMVATGSTADPHHYAATWIRSQWSINRVVK
jgi:hypothetical protein